MTRPEMLNALRADVDVLARAEETSVLGALPGWDSLAILLVVSHCEHVTAEGLQWVCNGANLRIPCFSACIRKRKLPARGTWSNVEWSN